MYVWVCTLNHVWLFSVSSTRLFCPWNFPGKNTGVGCHFLLKGIFLTQGSNPHLLCLLHWQVDSLPLVPPRKPRSLMRALLFLGTSCCALYLCVLSNSGVSVFTSPKEFLQSNSDDLQSQVIWGLLCPITKIPGLPFLWENLCGLISFQFASTCKCGFYFIVIVPLLLSHCGFFVFRSRAFWGIGSSFFFFVNSCLAVSHDFSVFVREGELTSFYSTILFSSVQ